MILIEQKDFPDISLYTNFISSIADSDSFYLFVRSVFVRCPVYIEDNK